jgi:3-deoxy-manno-octulosonate cytidylyltransferase (CMP-KDO synthetase)
VPGPFILAVIPARLQSTRLPNKPLLKIGAKTMLQCVWERAGMARLVNQVVIATDSGEILQAAEAFGAQVVMTSPEHPSGTDRVSQAAEQFDASLIVNVQGDEPFIEPASIDQAIEPLLRDDLAGNEAVMSTLMTPFRSPADAVEASAVKVVVGLDGHALYFSRLPIPFLRDLSSSASSGPGLWYKHLGLYVYRRDFLLRFPQLPRGPLEVAEKLEQLRVLENGYKIRVVETEHDSIGVDTEEDLARVREMADQQDQKTLPGTEERANV